MALPSSGIISGSQIGGEIGTKQPYYLKNMGDMLGKGASTSFNQFHNYTGIVKSDLVIHYDACNRNSYPRSGSTWYDQKNTYNGTLVNDPTYSANGSGSIVFDGSNDYIEVPGDKAGGIDTNLPFTFCWTFTSYGDTGNTLISGINTSGYFQIRAFSDGVQWLKSYTYQNNFDPLTTIVPSGYPIHLTITSGGGGGLIKCYINGDLKDQMNMDTDFISVFPTIGANYYTSETFYGELYNFLYYNRELNASEVLQNYNAIQPRLFTNCPASSQIYEFCIGIDLVRVYTDGNCGFFSQIDYGVCGS